MRSFIHILKIKLILCLCLNLLGCGFKQRGSITIPAHLQTICITPDDPYEELQRELRFQLAKNHVSIVNVASNNVSTLELSAPSFSKLILASGPSGQVQRFSLSMSTNYKISTPLQNYPQRTIVRTREISITNDKLLANEHYEQIIRKELLAETVQELLYQFTRPKVLAAAGQAKIEP